VWGMLGDPIGVLGDLVARENFAVVVALLAPVAFLPLLAPRYLLPIVPVLAVVFVADVAVTGPEGAANLVPAIVFIVVALPFALARLGRRNIERITVHRRILGALVLAALIFFVQDAPSSPYERPWAWGGRSLTDQARLEAISMVGGDDRVRTVAPTLADLAGRRIAVVVEDGPWVGGRALTAGVDSVLLDTSLTDNWSPTRLDAVVRAVEEHGFVRVLDRYGVLLFRRAELVAGDG
jgi:hypothetical protein